MTRPDARPPESPIQFLAPQVVDDHGNTASQSIWVKPVPQGTDGNTIKNVFMRWGQVDTVSPAAWAKVCSGYAFVNYYTIEDAIRAFENANRQKLFGDIPSEIRFTVPRTTAKPSVRLSLDAKIDATKDESSDPLNHRSEGLPNDSHTGFQGFVRPPPSAPRSMRRDVSPPPIKRLAEKREPPLYAASDSWRPNDRYEEREGRSDSWRPQHGDSYRPSTHICENDRSSSPELEPIDRVRRRTDEDGAQQDARNHMRSINKGANTLVQGPNANPRDAAAAASPLEIAKERANDVAKRIALRSPPLAKALKPHLPPNSIRAEDTCQPLVIPPSPESSPPPSQVINNREDKSLAVEQSTRGGTLRIPSTPFLSRLKNLGDETGSVTSTSTKSSIRLRLCSDCKGPETAIATFTPCITCKRQFHNTCGDPRPSLTNPSRFVCGKCLRKAFARSVSMTTNPLGLLANLDAEMLNANGKLARTETGTPESQSEGLGAPRSIPNFRNEPTLTHHGMSVTGDAPLRKPSTAADAVEGHRLPGAEGGLQSLSETNFQNGTRHAQEKSSRQNGEGMDSSKPRSTAANAQEENSWPAHQRNIALNVRLKAKETAERYKGVTCPWWKGKGCRYSAQECIFAHRDTGVEPPHGNNEAKQFTCWYWRNKQPCPRPRKCRFAHHDTGLYVGIDGSASMKHFTCVFWRQENNCKFTNYECAYAHEDTGLYPHPIGEKIARHQTQKTDLPRKDQRFPAVARTHRSGAHASEQITTTLGGRDHPKDSPHRGMDKTLHPCRKSPKSVARELPMEIERVMNEALGHLAEKTKQLASAMIDIDDRPDDNSTTVRDSCGKFVARFPLSDAVSPGSDAAPLRSPENIETARGPVPRSSTPTSFPLNLDGSGESSGNSSPYSPPASIAMPSQVTPTVLELCSLPVSSNGDKTPAQPPAKPEGPLTPGRTTALPASSIPNVTTGTFRAGGNDEESPKHLAKRSTADPRRKRTALFGRQELGAETSRSSHKSAETPTTPNQIVDDDQRHPALERKHHSNSTIKSCSQCGKKIFSGTTCKACQQVAKTAVVGREGSTDLQEQDQPNSETMSIDEDRTACEEPSMVLNSEEPEAILAQFMRENARKSLNAVSMKAGMNTNSLKRPAQNIPFITKKRPRVDAGAMRPIRRFTNQKTFNACLQQEVPPTIEELTRQETERMGKIHPKTTASGPNAEGNPDGTDSNKENRQPSTAPSENTPSEEPLSTQQQRQPSLEAQRSSRFGELVDVAQETSADASESDQLEQDIVSSNEPVDQSVLATPAKTEQVPRRCERCVRTHKKCLHDRDGTFDSSKCRTYLEERPNASRATLAISGAAFKAIVKASGLPLAQFQLDDSSSEDEAEVEAIPAGPSWTVDSEMLYSSEDDIPIRQVVRRRSTLLGGSASSHTSDPAFFSSSDDREIQADSSDDEQPIRQSIRRRSTAVGGSTSNHTMDPVTAKRDGSRHMQQGTKGPQAIAPQKHSVAIQQPGQRRVSTPGKVIAEALEVESQAWSEDSHTADRIATLQAQGVQFESDSDEDMEDEEELLAGERTKCVSRSRPNRSRNLFEVAPSLKLDVREQRASELVLPWEHRSVPRKQIWENLLERQCRARKLKFGDPHHEIERDLPSRKVRALIQQDAVDEGERRSNDRFYVPEREVKQTTLTFEQFLGMPEEPVVCRESSGAGNRARFELAFRDGKKERLDGPYARRRSGDDRFVFTKS